MTPRFGDLVITRWSARFRGRVFPCSLGWAGIGFKLREGDGLTPFGTFQIEWAYLRPDRPAGALPIPLRMTGLNDGWSDDPSDPDYNQPVTRPHTFRSEPLRRADPVYDLVAVLDFNRNPAVQGKGSAIFLHVWRRPRHPTAGCVAFRQGDLAWILARWTRRARVIIRA